MKITLLIRGLGVGGAERQIELLAKGLHTRGHDVTLLLFYDGGERAARLIADGVKVRSLRKYGRWDTLGFTTRLLRELRAAAPDVLYTFLGSSNLLAGLLKPALRCKTVWSIRASALDMGSYDRLANFTAWGEARLSRSANRIVSNSEAGQRDAIARGFPASKIIVIPNGIDTERFRPDAAARMRFRDAQRLADDTIAVGLVGRFDPMKGHPVFLQAIRLLAVRAPRLRFFCIGGGDDTYRSQLQNEAAAMRIDVKIGWLLPATDMVAVYNGLDLLCSASIFGEGFPNVIGEAMSCGLTCVGTDVGDSPKIIGNQALIAQAGDAAALAAVIETGLEARRSSRAVRARIENHFSLDNMIARTEAVLAAG